MKKNSFLWSKMQFRKWIPAFCLCLFLVGIASCAQGYDTEYYSSSVTNAQLESPDPTKITVSTVTNATGEQELKIDWPVVYGAGGVRVYIL